MFGRSELRLPKNCDVRSSKEKKNWTRDTGIGWALNFPSFGVLNLPKVLMIFAMKSCAAFFSVPKVSDPTKGRDLVYGTGGVRWEICEALRMIFFINERVDIRWEMFFLNIVFAYLVYLYLSSPGRFFFGLQVDHYLTATVFRVFPSIRCAKEVQKLKNKEI